MNNTYATSKAGNIYKPKSHIYEMQKKRVGSLTLDSDLVDAIEEIRSSEKFKPSRSEVINSLLKDHKDVKKRLKKNVK